ncbi:hypothetical protein ACLOJK_010852 [Asimina triloba]
MGSHDGAHWIGRVMLARDGGRRACTIRDGGWCVWPAGHSAVHHWLLIVAIFPRWPSRRVVEMAGEGAALVGTASCLWICYAVRSLVVGGHGCSLGKMVEHQISVLRRPM